MESRESYKKLSLDDIKKIKKDMNFLNMQIMSFSSIKKQLIRQKKCYNDPVIRYSIIIELIRTALDIGLTMIRAKMNENMENSSDYDPENPKDIKLIEELEKTEEKSNSIINELQIEFESLFNDLQQWIENPSYSPEHPLGKELMKKAESDYLNKEQEKSKNLDNSTFSLHNTQKEEEK